MYMEKFIMKETLYLACRLLKRRNGGASKSWRDAELHYSYGEQKNMFLFVVASEPFKNACKFFTTLLVDSFSFPSRYVAAKNMF